MLQTYTMDGIIYVDGERKDKADFDPLMFDIRSAQSN